MLTNCRSSYEDLVSLALWFTLKGWQWKFPLNRYCEWVGLVIESQTKSHFWPVSLWKSWGWLVFKRYEPVFKYKYPDKYQILLLRSSKLRVNFALCWYPFLIFRIFFKVWVFFKGVKFSHFYVITHFRFAGSCLICHMESGRTPGVHLVYSCKLDIKCTKFSNGTKKGTKIFKFYKKSSLDIWTFIMCNTNIDKLYRIPLIVTSQFNNVLDRSSISSSSRLQNYLKPARSPVGWSRRKYRIILSICL